jgi:membrane-bound lysozyme inhibitor of c-type lysozyme MliC
MRRLSIAAALVAAPLGACKQQSPVESFTAIARPAPDDPTPAGIAYLCEGRQEVAVVYAKNRASVTFHDKTWRTEYQATAEGFRYVDSRIEWVGRDDLAALREPGNTKPLAYNCRPTRRTT